MNFHRIFTRNTHIKYQRLIVTYLYNNRRYTNNVYNNPRNVFEIFILIGPNTTQLRESFCDL